jgi:hypothetical protein
LDTVVEASDSTMPTVQVKIYENDVSGPSVSIAPGSAALENGSVTFTLTRTGTTEELGQSATVSVSLSETGDMLSGSRSRSVTFPATSSAEPIVTEEQAKNATLMVELEDDNFAEDRSEITATITAPSGYKVKGLPWATVLSFDNDLARLALSVDPNTLDEDERESSTVTVSIIENTTFAENQTINLAFGGTADKGTDYTVRAETLTLRAGQREVSITITAVNDSDGEPAETITVSASHESRSINSSPRTVTILASDGGGATDAVNFESATYRVNEGSTVDVTVTVATVQSGNVTVPITMDGTATAIDDYTFADLTGNNNVLTINANQGSASSPSWPWMILTPKATRPSYWDSGQSRVGLKAREPRQR